MFEYYFRGRKDSGEWVYGGIVAITGTDDKTEYCIVSDSCKIKVQQNTIGQYTGYNDCNGRKIFVGDVLRCLQLPCYTYTVFMRDDLPVMALEICKNGKLFGYDDFTDFVGSEVEIIGNMYADE